MYRTDLGTPDLMVACLNSNMISKFILNLSLIDNSTDRIDAAKQ